MKHLFHPGSHVRDRAHKPILTALSGISDFAQAVCSYSDMPIQRHDCENSVFLPAEQSSRTSGGVVRRRWRSCKLAVYMPKMKRNGAPLRFVCPNCTPPLPAHPLRSLPGWPSILLAICIRLQLNPNSFVLVKVALAKTQTMAIDITDIIQNRVRSL